MKIDIEETIREVNEEFDAKNNLTNDFDIKINNCKLDIECKEEGNENINIEETIREVNEEFDAKNNLTNDSDIKINNCKLDNLSAKIEIDELNVDDIIERSWEVRGLEPGIIVKHPENDVKNLTIKSRDIFIQQPVLLELEAPINVCGDIHGQQQDLLKIFEKCSFPSESNQLFLGDYVDRGDQSLETICLLLAYKIKQPDNIFLLRGNHECASINRIQGFQDECKRRQNIKIWKMFTDCFNCLPICATINNRIFCTHGGLSPELVELNQINKIMRPTDIPDTGLLCDLLWSDPHKDTIGWEENDRGVSFTFGVDVLDIFLKKHDLDLILRAHQVVEDGQEFFADRNLVTIFSAPNYCEEFDNAGAVIFVDEDLMCSFTIFDGKPKTINYTKPASTKIQMENLFSEPENLRTSLRKNALII